MAERTDTPNSAPEQENILSTGADEYARSRSERVRNFRVHIEDDAGIGDFSHTKDQPVYKGEVYFSNHARSAGNGPVQGTRPDVSIGRSISESSSFP